ncbi:MAG: DUF4139 domain-containing protein [Bacteroidales bacterium]|nr:DUF4139 domain-containing protein [Bacteroidales bacterium]
MKKLLLLTLCLGAACALTQAQTEQRLTAKITQATVYLQGATLTHTASASLKSGAQELTIEGLSPEIDLNSLKVTCGHSSTIVSSVEFSTDYMTVQTEAAQLQKLRDSLAIYQQRLQEVNNDINLNTKLLKTLSDGIAQNTQQKDKILSVNELTACMDLYKAKAPGLQKTIDADNALKAKLNQRISSLKAQIQQDETKERQRSGILRLSVATPLATVEHFTIRYYTAKAAWTPCYDIQVKGVNQPVSLLAKAQIRQTTGMDWNQVKINLSNATPNLTSSAPIFSTWFLRYRTYRQTKAIMMSASNTLSYASKTAKAVAEEETEECAEEPTAQEGTSGQASVLYLLNGNYISQSEFERIDPAYIESMEVLDAEQAALTYGKHATLYVLRTKSMEDYVKLKDNDLEIAYQLSLPYTVTGNGKAQLVDLKTYEIKADYYYYAAPKLAGTTYLMATLSDWEKLNLLPGQATINYNGTYAGKTQLRTGTTDTTLTLTLAEEPRITVKRVKRSEFSATKTMGNNVTETRSHLITVKNNLNKRVPFLLKEQYPVSTNKDIEVKLTEHTPAATQNNATIGVLGWKTELEAGESRTFIVTYSVKHPKDHDIQLE